MLQHEARAVISSRRAACPEADDARFGIEESQAIDRGRPPSQSQAPQAGRSGSCGTGAQSLKPAGHRPDSEEVGGQARAVPGCRVPRGLQLGLETGQPGR